MDAPGLGVQHTYHSAGREVRHKRMRNGRNMSADGLEIDACRCASIVKAGNTRKVIARAMSNYMRRTREYNNYNNYSLVRKYIMRPPKIGPTQHGRHPTLAYCYVLPPGTPGPESVFEEAEGFATCLSSCFLHCE